MQSEGSCSRKERAMLLSRINSEAENTESERNVGIRLQQEEITHHRTLWSKPQTKRNDFLFPRTGGLFYWCLRNRAMPWQRAIHLSFLERNSTWSPYLSRWGKCRGWDTVLLLEDWVLSPPVFTALYVALSTEERGGSSWRIPNTAAAGNGGEVGRKEKFLIPRFA